eukprot:c18322_g1_i3.p2 GENE.c18322_g1_i3~~c18322_g1_i3.p2  ORF type:complete len:117 (-),score=26.42 c18322_g1_i3:104-454(-)
MEVFGGDEFENSFDAVVTCFFIDCTHNIVALLRQISRLLKPGGYWINLGPLQYHLAGSRCGLSVELCFDEIESILPQLGFRILQSERRTTEYCENQASMTRTQFESVFLTCQKDLR